MGGKPCIRGMRVTVGTVVGLVAAGRTQEEILSDYPYLEAEDIAEALSYAAWRAEEVEVSLSQRCLAPARACSLSRPRSRSRGRRDHYVSSTGCSASHAASARGVRRSPE